MERRGSVWFDGKGTAGRSDGISGETGREGAFNHAIVQSARLVARSRGLTAGAASAAMIDTVNFAPLTWSELIAVGAVQQIRIHPGGKAGTGRGDVALDLHAAGVHPPPIGRTLLGPIRYGRH